MSITENPKEQNNYEDRPDIFCCEGIFLECLTAHDGVRVAQQKVDHEWKPDYKQRIKLEGGNNIAVKQLVKRAGSTAPRTGKSRKGSPGTTG